MAKPKPKRSPEEEARRRQFNVMQRAFKLMQIRTSKVIIATAIKKDRRNISNILNSHIDITNIRQDLSHYFRSVSPGIWKAALRAVWLSAGQASIELHRNFFVGKGIEYDSELDIEQKVFLNGEDEDEWAPIPEFNFFETKAADPSDTWASSVDAYLRGGGSDHISGITDSTKDNVMGAIADGVAAGSPTRDIAASVESQLNTTWPGRAQSIAMTETAAACNQASLETAQATAPQLNKTWTCSFVPRSRETHMDADGQSVPQSEPFQIGDDELMFPCDPDGSVDEIVNCLCSIGYEEAPTETAEGEAQPEEGAAPDLTDQQTSQLADLFDNLASGTGTLSDDERTALAGQINDIISPEEEAEEATPPAGRGRKPVVPPPEEENVEEPEEGEEE